MLSEELPGGSETAGRGSQGCVERVKRAARAFEFCEPRLGSIRPKGAQSPGRIAALSFVPDLTFGFDTGSAATLITRHTVAAAIVVPTLAGRLARTR